MGVSVDPWDCNDGLEKMFQRQGKQMRDRRFGILGPADERLADPDLDWFSRAAIVAVSAWNQRQKEQEADCGPPP